MREVSEAFLDRVTSGQVNQLIVDRGNKRQSNRGTKFFRVTNLQVDKLTREQVNELLEIDKKNKPVDSKQSI